MTSTHANCTHPKTKAARAKCRKNKVEVAALWAEHDAEAEAYHEAYVRPYQEQEAARLEWEAECLKFAEAHIDSAHENADDTAAEEGFEPYSKRWYKIAISTLHHARDTADRVLDFRDPQKGQLLEVDGEYRWIHHITYLRGWAFEVTLIDDMGTRSTHALADLIP